MGPQKAPCVSSTPSRQGTEKVAWSAWHATSDHARCDNLVRRRRKRKNEKTQPFVVQGFHGQFAERPEDQERILDE